ncbi:ParM/StbA family protein [Photobacterium leiognathi]|uniref:ParM/StbA family protein n=1 Tax=Photobacterium leiognathi TaxID=553611 RepID=UPI0029829688|nr:ParM/StbA family protein [Photobacterium leiognathi]
MRNIEFITVDDGSGNMKLVRNGANGEKISKMSPSYVMTGDPLMDGVGVAATAWELDDVNYSVGDNLQQIESTTSTGYQTSIINRVLVNNIVAMENIDGPIALGVTLPTAEYFSGNGKNPINLAKIEAKKKNIMGELTNVSGLLKRPNIVAVRVYPEAIPAYVYCANEGITSASGAIQDYRKDEVNLVIDLGHYTCDIARITNGLNITAKASFDHGVNMLLDRYRTKLSIEFSQPYINKMSLEKIKTSFEEGQWRIGSELHDTTEIIDSLTVNFFRELTRKIEDAIGGEGMIEGIDRVIIVGGGAHIIGNVAEQEQYNHNIVIPPQPEFAIARGVHMLMMSKADEIIAELTPPAEKTPAEVLDD